MNKLKAVVESLWFQNAILLVIAFNAVIMGLQTSESAEASMGPALAVLDSICLGIFTVELGLKFVAYRARFFLDGWNWFDFVVVLLSLLSGLAFLKVFRVFRIFRIFRTLKALKGLRAMRLASRLVQLRMIVGTIGKSIPGISWSAVLLLLIYYVFALVGTSFFGKEFPDWFGNIGRSFYTLFQVMTLESWSMGISRPVMAVFGWAWLFFIPFVLLCSFVIMNVVVGIVVNSISEVQAELASGHVFHDPGPDPEDARAARDNGIAELAARLDAIQQQLSDIENRIGKAQ